MDDLNQFLSRAREKARSRVLRPVWNPQQIGEELYGVVVDAFPNPWDDSVTAYVVRAPDGSEYMTPRNKVLVDLLNEYNPSIGDLIYIRYEGTGREKKGRNAPKLYAVYVEKRSAGSEAPEQTRAEAPEVETAAEVEGAKAGELEKLAEAVQTIGKLYGYYATIDSFERALAKHGFNLSAKEVEELLPDMVKVTKHGVKIRKV